jgi:hypothetical protein
MASNSLGGGVVQIFQKNIIHYLAYLSLKKAQVKFQIYRENRKELYVNGIITYDTDDNVIFRVPLYHKCLYTAFYPYVNGEGDRIRGEMDSDAFLSPNGHLNMDTIVENYKIYALRRGFRYFREKDDNGNYISLKEAALMYSFDTYINALVALVGGKTYLEPTTTLGRSDLVINHKGQEYVVETKV